MDTGGEPTVIGRRALLVRAAAVTSAAIAVAACGNDGPPQAAPPTNAPATNAPATDAPAGHAPSSGVGSSGTGSSAPTGSGHDEDAHGARPATPDAPGGPSADAVDATGDARVMVLARDNTFAPLELIVSARTEVVWRNGGRTEHDVIPVDPAQQWGVALADFLPGETYAHVFDEPGSYPYYCTIHGTSDRGMIGTIHVVA